MATNVTARMPRVAKTDVFTGAPTLADGIVIALVLAALVGGWLVRSSVLNRMTSYSNSGVELNYPAGWLPKSDDTPGTLLDVTGGASDAPFQPTLTVRTEPVTADAAKQGIEGVQVARSVVQSKTLPAFRSLGGARAQLGSSKALVNEYAYLYDPSTNPLSNVSVPAVVHAQEVLVLKGEKLYVITFATAAEDWERAQPDWERIRSSIRL